MNPMRRRALSMFTAARSGRLAGALFAAIVFASSGCSWFQADLSPPREHELPGIAALRYDGLDVFVVQDPKGGGKGLTLYAHGGKQSSAALRVGDRFTLTDSEKVSDTYQVMAVENKLITLKCEHIENRHELREGYRKSARVFTIEPYGGETAQ